MKYAAFAVMLMGIVLLGSSCKNTASYALDKEPVPEVQRDQVMGKWKFEEDTNSGNFYEVTRAHSSIPNQYHIRFWNRGGINPTYEANGFFSVVKGYGFFNVPYFEKGLTNFGYGFLKLIEIDPDFTSITAAVVGDETMRSLASEDEVRKYVTAHVDDPAFYSDTIHLFKFIDFPYHGKH